MAKKKEAELSYLQMPLPSSQKCYKMTKHSWMGLDYSHTLDSGAMSQEANISTLEAPYLVPSEKPAAVCDSAYENPIGIFGFETFLLVLYRQGTDLLIDYMTLNEDGTKDDVYTGTLQSGNATWADEYPRCVVQFNAYEESDDIISGSYTKKLLIFPDKKSMDFEVTADGFAAESISGMPDIQYAAVHLSRLFGVSGDRVYASGFNDYTNWNVDTVDEYDEGNAWCTASQSNTKSIGDFTGITNFQGHIICFKRDYMHEIYNTKNPFRIRDIYAEGTVDHRSIQDVDGKLIFVSDDTVKVYTGSNPRVIGYPLHMNCFSEAVSGTDGRCYYLYCTDTAGTMRLFVYDAYIGAWSERTIESAVLGFSHTRYGMYMLCLNGNVYRMDSNCYDHNWCFETELMTNETVDIKHVKKLQMLADIAADAEMHVYLLYDDETFNAETSQPVYSTTGNGRKTIRVKPRQTANYGIKLHVEGCGFVKLYELELVIESGGDLYV